MSSKKLLTTLTDRIQTYFRNIKKNPIEREFKIKQVCMIREEKQPQNIIKTSEETLLKLRKKLAKLVDERIIATAAINLSNQLAKILHEKA